MARPPARPHPVLVKAWSAGNSILASSLIKLFYDIVADTIEPLLHLPNDMLVVAKG